MKNRWSAAALLAAVFFAGIAATLGTLRVVENRRAPEWRAEGRQFWRGERPPRGSAMRPPSPMNAPPFSELARARVTDRMTRALQLTDDQRERIEAAMEERRVASQEAMNRVLPGLREQMDSLHAEIEAILTPEQQELFRDFMREDNERSRRRNPWMMRSRSGGPR